MPDHETETIIRRREDTPAPRPHVPELCPDPGRACRWDQERSDLFREIRGMREDMKQILAALATGKEKMRSIDQIETQMEKLTADVIRLQETVATLKTIVFGACGFILLAVLGGLVSLVILKG
jgi:hypothetical protein